MLVAFLGAVCTISDVFVVLEAVFVELFVAGAVVVFIEVTDVAGSSLATIGK